MAITADWHSLLRMYPRDFEKVTLTVRMWRPVVCPECGDAGPFYGLSEWVPVLIGGDLEVDEVLDAYDIWPNLDDDGPGLMCRSCIAVFYPVATVFRPEVYSTARLRTP